MFCHCCGDDGGVGELRSPLAVFCEGLASVLQLAWNCFKIKCTVSLFFWDRLFRILQRYRDLDPFSLPVHTISGIRAAVKSGLMRMSLCCSEPVDIVLFHQARSARTSKINTWSFLPLFSFHPSINNNLHYTLLITFHLPHLHLHYSQPQLLKTKLQKPDSTFLCIFEHSFQRLEMVLHLSTISFAAMAFLEISGLVACPSSSSTLPISSKMVDVHQTWKDMSSTCSFCQSCCFVKVEEYSCEGKARFC